MIRDTSSIQRGIIRHLCLIIDLSLAMTDRDLRPTRLEMSLAYAQVRTNSSFNLSKKKKKEPDFSSRHFNRVKFLDKFLHISLGSSYRNL